MLGNFTRKEFLEALFQPYYREYGGFITVRSSNRLDLKTSTRYFPTTDSLAREHYSQEQNVFFGVCPREKMKPGKEHVRYLTAIWAGVDIGPDGYCGKEKYFANERQAMMAVKTFELPPSIVVQSGRGMHLYWLLDKVAEIQDPESLEKLLQGISGYFQCNNPAHIDTMLRLPGTINFKNPNQPVECYVDHIDTKFRYSLNDFQGLDLRIIIPSKKAPKIAYTPPLAPKNRIVVIDENDRPPVSEPQLEDPIPLEPTPLNVPTPPPLQEPAEAPSPNLLSPGAAQMEALAEKIVDAFSEKLLDRLADRIVQRLLGVMGRQTGK